ncbi:LiaF transmembrane domain-containing protein [Arcticibacter sp.]|jgi:hypothetical protein|uniref:LiaF transmembrane domain-containing protein n=1 Tax=Arcticibacter sp. TaxID=1872630 RepID=UPI00388D9CC3
MENQRAGSGIAGILLIAFGTLLLVHTLGGSNIFPGWLISWPMILISIGVISGVKNHFSKAGPYLCIATGMAFLASKINPSIFSVELVVPAVLLAIGLYLLFGKHRKCDLGSHSEV